MTRLFYLIALVCSAICIAGPNSYGQTSDIPAYEVIYSSRDDKAKILPTVTDTSKFALIYIYRVKRFRGSFVTYTLYMDNEDGTKQVIGDIRKDTRMVVKVNREEKIRLWAKTEKENDAVINVKFGRSYHLKCAITPGVTKGRPSLVIAPKEEAMKEFMED